MSTLDKIEKLALIVAEKATNKDTPLQESIEALKVLAPYYSALKKNQGDAGSPDEPTMAALRDQVQDRANGGAVSRRQRRN